MLGISLPVAIVFAAYLISAASLGAAADPVALPTTPPNQSSTTASPAPSPDQTSNGEGGSDEGPSDSSGPGGNGGSNEGPGEQSGNCDEPEHADDAECRNGPGSDSGSSGSGDGSGSNSGSGSDSDTSGSGSGGGSDNSGSGGGGDDRSDD
jgi:hypothetical protein